MHSWGSLSLHISGRQCTEYPVNIEELGSLLSHLSRAGAACGGANVPTPLACPAMLAIHTKEVP